MAEREFDMAASMQKVTEEIVLRWCATCTSETGLDNLCMAGGVALNCVANGRVIRESPFEELWVQPAAGDAGGALGVAHYIYNTLPTSPRAAAGPRLPGARVQRRRDRARSSTSAGATYETLARRRDARARRRSCSPRAT